MNNSYLIQLIIGDYLAGDPKQENCSKFLKEFNSLSEDEREDFLVNYSGVGSTLRKVIRKDAERMVLFAIKGAGTPTFHNTRLISISGRADGTEYKILKHPEADKETLTFAGYPDFKVALYSKTFTAPGILAAKHLAVIEEGTK